VYTLADYLWMIADEARVAAYAGALQALVRPGTRVLEVGAGFGFFSVLAARAGAGRVDAVDTNPAIHLGPKIAAANGCADGIAFHFCDVTRLTLDQPADVLLIDVRGPTPFGCRSLEILMNVRDRLLRPGAAIIAARDMVMAAPVRTPAAFQREVQSVHSLRGVILDPVERVVYDTPMQCSIEPDDVLADGKPWLMLDYATIERTDHAGEACWEFDEAATVDGLGIWFTADVGGGYGFSTGPGRPGNVYRQIFIPFRSAVHLDGGERLRVGLSVRQVRHSYLWEWRGWVGREGVAERQVVQQNSLAEIVLDPAALPLTSPDAIPALGPRARALRDLLARIDGRRSISGLAAGLVEETPSLFVDPAAAAEFVSTWIAEAERLERGTD
jgi:predicted RNA methylase